MKARRRLDVKSHPFQPPLHVPAALSPINHGIWKLVRAVITAKVTEWTSEKQWVDSRHGHGVYLLSKTSRGAHLFFYFKGTGNPLIGGGWGGKTAGARS